MPKLTSRPEALTVDVGDLLHIVKTPTSTPVSKKIKSENFFAGLATSADITNLQNQIDSALAIKVQGGMIESGDINSTAVYFPIVFPVAYTNTPTVIVSISKFDMDAGVNGRMLVEAQSITTTGFTCKVETWSGQHLFASAVSWIAFGT